MGSLNYWVPALMRESYLNSGRSGQVLAPYRKHNYTVKYDLETGERVLTSEDRNVELTVTDLAPALRIHNNTYYFSSKVMHVGAYNYDIVDDKSSENVSKRLIENFGLITKYYGTTKCLRQAVRFSTVDDDKCACDRCAQKRKLPATPTCNLEDFCRNLCSVTNELGHADTYHLNVSDFNGVVYAQHSVGGITARPCLHHMKLLPVVQTGVGFRDGVNNQLLVFCLRGKVNSNKGLVVAVRQYEKYLEPVETTGSINFQKINVLVSPVSTFRLSVLALLTDVNFREYCARETFKSRYGNDKTVAEKLYLDAYKLRTRTAVARRKVQKAMVKPQKRESHLVPQQVIRHR